MYCMMLIWVWTYPNKITGFSNSFHSMQCMMLPIETLSWCSKMQVCHLEHFHWSKKCYSSVSIVHWNQHGFTQHQIFQLLVLYTVFSPCMKDMDNKYWLNGRTKLKERVLIIHTSQNHSKSKYYTNKWCLASLGFEGKGHFISCLLFLPEKALLDGTERLKVVVHDCAGHVMQL